MDVLDERGDGSLKNGALFWRERGVIYGGKRSYTLGAFGLLTAAGRSCVQLFVTR